MGKEAKLYADDSRIRELDADADAQRIDRCEDVLGIVLAGVHAWGDCPLEQVVCRPLLPIMSEPLIWHTLSWLKDHGVERAQICANSDTSLLRRTLGYGGPRGLALEYYEDAMPRGPGGCVKDASFGSRAGAFVVVDGTLIPGTDLRAILRAHRESGAVMTVVVAREDGEEASPQAPLEPVGIHVLSPKALEAVPDVGYQDIKESLIPRLHAQGDKIATFVVPSASVPRVGASGSYLAVNHWALERGLAKRTPPEGYRRLGEAWVHESSVVEESARLVGAVLVAPQSTIHANSMIVGPTSIGRRCIIERDAVVSSSVLWDGCHIGHGALVDQCVLTYDACIEKAAVVRKTVCIPAERGKLAPQGRQYCVTASSSLTRSRANGSTTAGTRTLDPLGRIEDV